MFGKYKALNDAVTNKCVYCYKIDFLPAVGLRIGPKDSLK